MSMYRTCRRFGGEYTITPIQKGFSFVEGPLEILDHSSALPAYGSKVGIDATKKVRMKGIKGNGRMK